MENIFLKCERHSHGMEVKVDRDEKTQIILNLLLVFGNMVKIKNHHLNKDGIIFGQVKMI